ncbi:MAG: hypothetical protein C0425_05795 [Chlorobiaceae bacterium]|nr:hypothetical protein [Chlorobiaceae bacterium]
MKNILFFTYFWPPSGKASLHWPLKIIKYLPEFDFNPIVVTVDEETFTQKDESLLKEISPNLKVIKTKVFEPFSLYKKFIGKSKDDQLIASETISKANRSLAHRISIWIRMNLFVPDARVGWYPFAMSEAKKILRSNNIHAIVTIGPPHSTHLIGLRLSKLFKIPHIPILIDPWVDIIYYKDFKRNAFTLKLDKYLEEKVFDNSFRTVFVTESTREDYNKKYSFLKNKSEVLYWGYDEEYFLNRKKELNKDYEIILHAGNLFDYQNPINFWKKVKSEIEKGRKLKLRFIGTVSPAIINTLTSIGLIEHSEILGFLSYEDAVQEMMNADFLLVCPTERRHLPGKLFEYMRTGNKIIAFGDENEEVKKLIEKSNSGGFFRYESDAESVLCGSSIFQTDINFAKTFDRKAVAKGLVSLFNEI